MATIIINGNDISIDGLHVTDQALGELLREVPETERADKVRHALAVGSRGLMSMGVGVSVAQVGEAVEAIVRHAADRSEENVAALLDESTRRISSVFDPDDRTSIVSRTLADIEQTLEGLLARLDPRLDESHTGLLLSRLDGALGEGGELDKRLSSSLDPTDDASALGALKREVERGLRDLRDLFVREEGRTEEAERGTMKGFEFEDRVEERLRTIAAGLGGCVVERTSTDHGVVGAQSMVGDAVLTLAGGVRIVVEAKNTARIGLSGATGILDELDRAMANRNAQFAICISAREAFPSEVGVFGVYGNRLLVVDDGSGDMIGVAVRWAQVATAAAAVGRTDVDTAYVLGRLERVKALATRFSKSKRALTGMRSTIDEVRAELDSMRGDLLDLVDDAERELTSQSPYAEPEASIRIA